MLVLGFLPKGGERVTGSVRRDKFASTAAAGGLRARHSYLVTTSVHERHSKPHERAAMDLTVACIVHDVCCTLLTGLIWTIQVVHYPLFAEVGTAQFAAYEQAHQESIVWLVMPLMLAELATAIWLALADPSATRAVGLALVLTIWCSTALVQVPLHTKLSKAFEPAGHARLVRTNWVRTWAWSVRCALITLHGAWGTLTAASLTACVLGGATLLVFSAWWPVPRTPARKAGGSEGALLPCIRARRSVLPSAYVQRPVGPATVDLLLEAAMWAPFHGSRPPWRFVVLGRSALAEMQHVTLDYYDAHWREHGWGSGTRGTEAQYNRWRSMTEGEITGRWGPVSFMVAICVRRQAGSKRLPLWEEAAATACAVQNMHLQASAFPGGLACYWSSWHDAARDSDEMRTFLGLEREDCCLGFFMVAACDPLLKDSRTRSRETHLDVEWRS